MKRVPAEITKGSAAHIAKCRIQEMLDHDELDIIKRFALKSAIKDGGGVDEIATILWDLGLHMTVDTNNPTHQQWITDGAVVLEITNG